MRNAFSYFPRLYIPRDGCSDYLHPGFVEQIDRAAVATIFEVGCANGADTLRLSRTFPAFIYAFECNPDILAETRKRLAGEQRIRLVEQAAWDADITIPFFPVVSATENGRPVHNPGASSCFRARPDYIGVYTQREAMVETTRLDTYCARNGIVSIDLLCIDAQGAELHILKGLGDAIDSVRYVISEIEVQPIYYHQDQYPAVHGYLKSKGFVQRAEVYRDRWFSDYLYVRRSLM